MASFRPITEQRDVWLVEMNCIVDPLSMALLNANRMLFLLYKRNERKKNKCNVFKSSKGDEKCERISETLITSRRKH
jgi:hypothetical protein